MRRAAAVTALGLVLVLPARLEASPYRLQADAYGRAEPGVALLTLQGDAQANPWVSVEAMVWSGLRYDLAHDGPTGDVMVIALNVHDPERRFLVQMGRFVKNLGATRPVQLDGVSGRLRLPWDFRVESYAGSPVLPDFRQRKYDWVVGGRVSRALGDWGSLGVAYQHRRDAGSLANEEIGLDAGAAVTDWLEMSSYLSYDLVNPGFSEIRASGHLLGERWRAELFGTHRSPSRILPSTSLFSVLGDVASRNVGVSFDYEAAPRLDLNARGAARLVGGRVGESVSAGAVLRLDDTGQSAVRVGIRREGLPEGDWTGLRAAGRVGVLEQLAVSTELELVVPDDPGNRGRVWPWALLGLTWQPTANWRVAAAVQGSTSPEHSSRLDGILRLTYRAAESS